MKLDHCWKPKPLHGRMRSEDKLFSDGQKVPDRVGATDEQEGRTRGQVKLIAPKEVSFKNMQVVQEVKVRIQRHGSPTTVN